MLSIQNEPINDMWTLEIYISSTNFKTEVIKLNTTHWSNYEAIELKVVYLDYSSYILSLPNMQ